nr:Do family serine endopeptidase [Mangrovicoccus algicola]
MSTEISTWTRQSGRFVWALALGLSLAIGAPQAGQARSAPDSFADLAEHVSDAVVNITTTTVIAAQPSGPGNLFPEGSPFEEFFREFNNPRQDEQRQRRGQALGSGFVISPDGYIVTNNHVIESADEISIEFFSGRTLDAEVVGTDPKTDIALLKVESDEDLPFVEFGDSEAMRVGDWVMAMGNPLGQGFSVSAGIVSAKARALQGSYDDFIQTDAAINRGNSGGPLFDMEGDVIGVNTAILSPNGGSIGIGFAMSSNVVSRVVDQLQEYGETRRGWLGVRIQDVDEQLAEALGLASAEGALVTDVPEGPALEAGMQSGDVITAFDGRPVEDTRSLVRQVGDTTVGKTVPVTVIREGNEVALDVTLGRRETAEAVPAAMTQEAPASEGEILGMTLSTMTDEIRQELGLSDTAEGVVVRDLDEAGDAFAKGIRAGDVIAEAGQVPVADLAALEAQIAAAKDAGRKSLLLLVRRADQPRFVALALDGN